MIHPRASSTSMKIKHKPFREFQGFTPHLVCRWHRGRAWTRKRVHSRQKWELSSTAHSQECTSPHLKHKTTLCHEWRTEKQRTSLWLETVYQDRHFSIKQEHRPESEKKPLINKLGSWVSLWLCWLKTWLGIYLYIYFFKCYRETGGLHIVQFLMN